MEATLSNTITVAIVGFSVVLLCLIFFALLISGINKIDGIMRESKSKKLLENTKQMIYVAENASSNSDEELLPIIMAAVYSSVSKNVVIRKITFAHSEGPESAWSQISRAKHIDSHNIQRTRTIYENK